MSAPKFQLLLTKPAKKDFSEILGFTNIKWGENQRVSYKHKIEKALHTLTKNPASGRKKYGYMMYTVERHKIYYRVEESTIKVIRILHERMDAKHHLLQ